MRFLVALLNPAFETVCLDFERDEVRLRGLDRARIILLDGRLAKATFSNYTVESEFQITLNSRDLRDYLQGLAGIFEDSESVLTLRQSRKSLGVDFRHGTTLARSKSIIGLSDEPITVPRFQGLSTAAVCSLSEPWRLGFVSQTFNERQTDLTVRVSKNQLRVSASKEDYLDLPGVGAGESETIVHRSVFEVLHPITGLDLAPTICEVSVVPEGVVRFSVSMGNDMARLAYFAVPIIKEQ